jgi:diadenosine tetraphosphate (Ap4A) HIT family hydrolase
MPELIDRAEALARIRADVGEAPCLMCAIRDDRAGDRWLLEEDEDLLVLLPRYVRRWGQILVMPRVHATTFTELDAGLWQRTSAVALRAARVIEEVMRPRRCYLASTGSAAGELLQSSTHVHVHVIPLYEPDDKPADIFSWEAGVYVGSSDEWRELRDRYRAAWR